MSMTIFQRLLTAVIGIVILLIISGTVIAGMSGRLNPAAGLRRRDPQPAEAAVQAGLSGASIYSAIGTLRASTADEPQIPVVITVFFPYPSDDTVFYEEISQKTRKLRIIITSYFAQYTRQQLLSRGEALIKKDLLDELNNELVSGSINQLFFEQYIFLD